MDNIDEIAEKLQNALFAGYSKRLKEELFNTANAGAMENPDSHVRITGVCGDTIEMFLGIRDEKIDDVKFLTDGCGFTVACANYVARTAKGKSIEEAFGIEQDEVDRYFEGLPEEHKHCAKLAVITLRALLEKYRSKPNPAKPSNANNGK
ncbi:MAG: iron-sulfur cluster assembly scaffold protein [Sedimentisphaerales bacterium]|nr:iron-sulfur cluster assembly scaffold protein [Sedimentisphaerales bacterium]